MCIIFVFNFEMFQIYIDKIGFIFFINYFSFFYVCGFFIVFYVVRGVFFIFRVSNDVLVRSCVYEYFRIRYYFLVVCQFVFISIYVVSFSNVYLEWYFVLSGNGYIIDIIRQYGGFRNDDVRGWLVRLVFIYQNIVVLIKFIQCSFKECMILGNCNYII